MTAQTGMVLKASIRSFSSEGVQRSLAPRPRGRRTISARKGSLPLLVSVRVWIEAG